MSDELLDANFSKMMFKSLSTDKEYFSKVMPILNEKHFSSVADKAIYNIFKVHYGKYSEQLALSSFGPGIKELKTPALRELVVEELQAIHATPKECNTEFMVDSTVTWVKLSIFMEALHVGAEGLMEHNPELLKKTEQLLDERSKITVDSNLGLDFDDIHSMIEYYSARDSGILTQHSVLNDRLGPGFLPGTLSLVLAPQGIGKSLFLTDLISGMVKQNKNILLVSLEMAEKEIMKRVHANAMDLPINSLIDLSKTPEELKGLTRKIVTKEEVLEAHKRVNADNKVGKLFIKDYSPGEFSTLMLEQLIQSYKDEHDVEFDIIYVDYLGIMKSDLLTPAAGLYSYIKSIAEELRGLARKIELPIISCQQLNRGAVGNLDADNAAVSDSMGAVMTADFMLFLLQTEEMKAEKNIICKITKNRFCGITDTWTMGIDYEKMRFQELIVNDVKAEQLENIAFNNLLDGNDDSPLDDFGLDECINDEQRYISSDKAIELQEYAEVTGDAIVKEIALEDFVNTEKRDNAKEPLNEMDQMFSDLGI